MAEGIRVRVAQDHVFPMGRRGARPVSFLGSPEILKAYRELPGVHVSGYTLACGLDFAGEIAAMLGVDAPIPADTIPPLPGLARYKELGFPEKLRPVQKKAMGWMVNRAFGILGHAPRAGKCAMALAAATALGLKHTIITGPAIAKWVWVDEILKWLELPAVVLEGRAGQEARILCLECRGKGTLVGALDGAKCPACRLKNGQSRGYHIIRGRDACLQAMADHPFTVVNYDLLVSQQEADAAGALHVREDLPGWAPLLARTSFDLAIADEAHRLRGRSTSVARRGKTRRERITNNLSAIPRAFAVSGTPIYGRPRDAYGIVDFISNGAFGRPFFNFDKRYCCGRPGAYGWENNGSSPLAETEMKQRLSHLMLKPPDSEIFGELPPKTRQVIRVEATDKDVRIAMREVTATGDYESRMAKGLAATGRIKVPVIAEAVLEELLCSPNAGDLSSDFPPRKVVVFSTMRANRDLFRAALEKAVGKKDVASRMQAVNLKLWAAGHNDSLPSVKERTAMAQAFREHRGAAVFISTIEAVPEAISLAGAQTVHFIELHYSPTPLLQGESRPILPGLPGITILYYVVPGTVDEHVEAIVLPKLRDLDRIIGDSNAAGIRAAFSQREEAQTAHAVWDRLTRHLES